MERSENAVAFVCRLVASKVRNPLSTRNVDFIIEILSLDLPRASLHRASSTVLEKPHQEFGTPGHGSNRIFRPHVTYCTTPDKTCRSDSKSRLYQDYPAFRVMDFGGISALYIFDEHNSLILDHVYNGLPPAPSVALQLYLQHASPRPSLMYLTSANPPAVLHAVIQDNLLFFILCLSDAEPLLVLEVLHRVMDALQEFLGSPLLASKVTTNYDVVAQILAEIADAGIVCRTDANALRDVVETGPGVLKHLLGGVGLPGPSPASAGSLAAGFQRSALQPSQTMQGSAIPWRRSNVRHTSNELYVDIVETISVILAPSGLPLSAFAHGSIAFTSKVSGVPDLLLSLSTGGKGAGMGNRGDQLRAVMERAVFHPCVRLNRWKADGVLSFVPPDGQFALCGYETDLLGPDPPVNSRAAVDNVNIPALVELNTNLGRTGSDFEVKVLQSSSRTSAAALSLQSNLNGNRSGSGLRTTSTADSKNPALENLSVSIPLASSVRNISDLHASKGEAQWLVAESRVEWKVSAKDLETGNQTLRCTVQGLTADIDEVHEHTNGMTATTYDYDDDQAAVHGPGSGSVADEEISKAQPIQAAQHFMPTSATLSYSVKGSVPSGLRVESLLIDAKKSRGLGDGVKPYKGVKYLTVSAGGIEARC
nr:isoform 2 of ap-3 complex subunit mu-1 [Quercus suber]